MKRTKLIFSIMLSLVMLLGLGCATAFAEEYGVSVQIGTDGPISINSENKDSIPLGDNCTAVYDAEKDLLTITGNVSSIVGITGNGSTDVVIEGKADADMPVLGGLAIDEVRDVTIQANTKSAPAVSSDVAISCSGDVLIQNSGTGYAVDGNLAVGAADNVTVLSTVDGNVAISCEGDITIKNSGTGLAVNGKLKVANANDVTVEATTSSAATINGGAEIDCSGDVLIKNNVPEGSDFSGYAVAGKLTVTNANDVTVEATASNAPAITGNVEIDCDGDITIKNSGSLQAVYGYLKVTKANNVTVEATADSAPTIDGSEIDENTRKGAEISCDGNVTIKNSGTGNAVSGYLKVTSTDDVTVKNVTVESKSSAPTITGNVEIECDGDITIKNSGLLQAVFGYLKVTKANNVTVEAVTDNAPTVDKYAEIKCNGDVSIKNSGNGFAVSGKLTVTNANDVTVEVNSTTPALTNGATINCSGNISVTNKGDMASTGSLTVTSANDVRISANTDGPAIVGALDIICDGRVEIENSGADRLFSESLNYTQKYGKAFTVETGESFSALEFIYSGTKTVNYSAEEIAEIGGIKAFRITPDGYFKNIEIIDGTADCETAAKGNEVTITADSKSGYTFDKWIVVEGDVELDDEYDSTTTFVVGDRDVVIEATYEKDEDEDNEKGSGSSFGLEEITGDKKKEDKEDKEDIKDNIVDETEETTIILTIGDRMAFVNGEYVENDVAPVIRNSRTMLPVRFVAEALGADVAWDEEAKKVTITKDDTVIEIYINQPFAFVNNEAIELDSPAFIENGRTYLPLRFIVENLGAEVEWDAVSQKVIIKY